MLIRGRRSFVSFVENSIDSKHVRWWRRRRRRRHPIAVDGGTLWERVESVFSLCHSHFLLTPFSPHSLPGSHIPTTFASVSRRFALYYSAHIYTLSPVSQRPFDIQYIVTMQTNSSSYSSHDPIHPVSIGVCLMCYIKDNNLLFEHINENPDLGKRITRTRKMLRDKRVQRIYSRFLCT
jgi:hypothetical protein